MVLNLVLPGNHSSICFMEKKNLILCNAYHFDLDNHLVNGKPINLVENGHLLKDLK